MRITGIRCEKDITYSEMQRKDRLKIIPGKRQPQKRFTSLKKLWYGKSCFFFHIDPKV